jgi:hypothetical protein
MVGDARHIRYDAGRVDAGEAVFLWGEADLIWTQGVIELFRWRRQRKAIAVQAAQLVTETEQFLARAER